jgi:hypothetical protein
MNVTFGGNTAGAAATVSTGTMGLAGGNNITLSQNGNAITINGATNGLTNVNLSAGTTSANLSNMVFSNSNGVSFGLNGSTITGTVATTYAASNHSHGNPTLNLTNLSGTTASASNGLTLSLSAAAQTVQTQNLHNMTLSGNTAGVMAQVSSGTLTLAGGNNITLSQNGNAISIIGGAGGAGGAALSAGTQSVSTGTVNFANSNGVTFGMSGSNQITASHNGITSQTNQTVGIYATGANTTGQSSSNTIDARSLVVSGQGMYAGMSGNTLQLSAATTYAASDHSHGNPTLALTNLSGTTASASNGLTLSLSAAAPGAGGGAALSAGTQSVSTGTVNFANSNGISFGMSGSNQITASYTVPTQSAQTANLYVSSNSTQLSSTAGVDLRSITFQGAGNVSIGVSQGKVLVSGAGGAGGGIALANSQTTYTSGTANLIEGGGAITIASTTGQQFNFSVPATSSLSATGALSIVTNGSTISIGVPYDTNNFYQNMDRGATALLGTANGTLMLQRLNQENARFAANLTANTVMMNISGSVTATLSSSAHTFSVSIGIYSDNITNLSLINSASSSWALAANTSNTAAYHGPRWLSFVASQWSSAPNFVNDGEYVFGVVFRSAGLAIPMSYIGQNYMQSAQRSGSLGVSVATNTSLAQGNYWNAMYSASTSAMPTVISSNQVNRNNATAIFMPHIILNNRYSGTF